MLHSLCPVKVEMEAKCGIILSIKNHCEKEINTVKRILCTLLAAMMLILCGTSAMASVNIRGINPGDTLYVDTPNLGTLNLRENGNASAKVLEQIPNGTAVVAGDKHNGNYLKVKVENVNHVSEGWVDMRYLSINPPKVKPAPTAAPAETVKSLNFSSYKLVNGSMTITAKPSRPGGYVNLRWVPSTDGAVIAKVYAGENLTVIAEGSKWYQVKNSKGYVGFIMKSFTEKLYY